jgi:plastocyanin
MYSTGFSMKTEHIFPVFVAVTLGCLFGIPMDETRASKKDEAKPLTVTIKSLSYDPKKLEIHVGDSVVWSNEARMKHTATSDDDRKTFDTLEIEPGKSSDPVKFEKEGEFKYHCKVHGKVMSGTIVVKAASRGEW